MQQVPSAAQQLFCREGSAPYPVILLCITFTLGSVAPLESTTFCLQRKGKENGEDKLFSSYRVHRQDTVCPTSYELDSCRPCAVVREMVMYFFFFMGGTKNGKEVVCSEPSSARKEQRAADSLLCHPMRLSYVKIQMCVKRRDMGSFTLYLLLQFLIFHLGQKIWSHLLLKYFP